MPVLVKEAAFIGKIDANVAREQRTSLKITNRLIRLITTVLNDRE